MDKNSLLSIANFFCQFFKILIGIAIIIITVVFIHIQFDKGFYNEWKFKEPENDSVIRIQTEFVHGENPQGEQQNHLSEWKTMSLYFNYFKFTAVLIFLYLSINQFRKVLKSVRKLKTFHQTNVRAFKKIGNYGLLSGGLSVFNYWEFGNHAISSFSIPFNILFIALIAFILAEIFKEGNSLMEDNQLTI